MVIFIPNWITVSIIVLRVLRKAVRFALEALLLLAWAVCALVVFFYRAVSKRGEGHDLPRHERRVRRPRWRDA